MSTIQGNVNIEGAGVATATWLDITEADTGSAVSLAGYPDKTVQVVGDFTSNGAITIEGSNDNATWATLTDNLGTALVLTDSTPKLIAQNPKYIRPRASAGASVVMDVYIVGSIE